MKIAIKFIPETKDEFGQARDYGLRECECYEALNSIKNSKITPYGIPCIHFCEKALNDKFYMIGMQLLDPIAEKLGLKPKIGQYHLFYSMKNKNSIQFMIRLGVRSEFIRRGSHRHFSTNGICGKRNDFNIVLL